MVKLFKRSFELGVKAVQLLADKPTDALIKACNSTGVNPFIIFSTNLSGSKLREALDKLSPLKPKVVAVHAEISDNRDIKKIKARLNIVKEYKSAFGLATHIPGVTIPWIEKANVLVDIILAPLNSLGYAMKPSFEGSLEAIHSSSRRIVAMKTLATGQLSPKTAFKFAYKNVESIAVGITSEKEMKETYEAATTAYQER